MSQEQGYVEAKLTMKNMLNVIPQLKASMTENQQKNFRGTCFGPWLDLSYTGNDPGLVHAMLQRKSERPIGIDEKYPADDEEIWFSFRPNFKIRFSRREFCLITGFKFSRRTDMAHYIPRSYNVETPPIRRRCFPNRKVNSNITITDIQKLLYDGADFVVSDDDVVRLAIILIVERAFMGKQGIHVVSKKYLWLVEDFAKLNDYPWGNRIWDATYPVVKDGFQARESQLEVGKGYTLVGFMWSFKIWILEAYRRTIKSFAHKTDKNGVPRALFWKRSSAETFSVTDYLHLLNVMLSDDVARKVKRLRVSEAEEVVNLDTEEQGVVEEEPHPIVEEDVVAPIVKKRKRSQKDWVNDEEIWSMVDRLVNDQGTLLPPPPNAWRDGRKHVGPAKDPKSMVDSKQETRCMFIFQNENFIYLTPEFWIRLLGLGYSGYLENLHIDGWATLMLRYRQRVLPRASQYSTPIIPTDSFACSSRWTVMPLGFLSSLAAFQSYYDDTQREEEKRKEAEKRGEVAITGENPPDYMYLIGLGDGSDELYPSWAYCDKILIPVHFYDAQHFILIVLNLEEQKILVYDSLPGHVDQEIVKLTKDLGDQLPVYLRAIDYFNQKQDSQIVDYLENKESIEFMTEAAPVVPVQGGINGDCGVWVCIHMERVIFGWDEIPNIGDPKKAAEDYRVRMAKTFFRARFDTQEPPPKEKAKVGN
ncbi:uncharacterized protein [Rutidosis leptorrhynchoides]|uniref:uncharacterized protein n=1 Tax=Rutidosis leptorrhynchoides TaxID=125765 RepID=UPI003A9969DE